MSDRFRMATEYTPDAMYFGTLRWLSHPASTGARNITAMDVVLAPGKAHSFHKHPKQEELLYVVSGEIEQWLDHEKRMMKAGDAIFIPPDVVHGTFNPGNREARLIVVFSPCVGDAFETVEMAEQAPWKDLRQAAR
jgi:quercetin dioxygenase-like cupin family protein